MSESMVLVVEDDAAMREALCDTLDLAGFRVSAAAHGEAALEALEREPVQLLVSDVQMRPIDGHELLRRVKRRRPDLPVVLMTAYGTIQKAVQALQDGASDYLVKPFEADALVNMVTRLLPRMQTEESGLIAADPRSHELVELARRVAPTDATVMLTGESGTGKEVLARFIHESSARARGPFVAINCAAIPENMLESELFGYEKGAFTGAYQSRAGRFEQAQGGTLLLDEVSEMDLALQAKLLRVLQEREVERLGGRKTLELDVRVLATSNRRLREEVAAGRFREDLFYRLNVFPLHVPALRERVGDILPIAHGMLGRRARGAAAPNLSAEAERRLMAHPWPGNVRELDNVIQRALILSNGGELGGEDIRFEPVSGFAAEGSAPIQVSGIDSAATDDGTARLGADLRSREQELIIEALRAGNGSRKAAAEQLGISPRTLRYKLAKLREAGIALPGLAGA